MITEIMGDLLESKANYICHQTNCKGVMGAGVAKQIKEKLLTHEQYASYQHLCSTYGSKALGYNQELVISRNPYQAVINMFGEDIPTGTGLDTNYDALYQCMKKVEASARYYGWSVAIPGRIGCGLAGGDWDYVKNHIIVPIFADSPVELTIVYWEKN